MDYITIKNYFIERHKKIDNLDYLDKYIKLLLNYELVNDGGYTERHHILPISTFPELKNEEWNIVELSYDDHKLSHLWLFKSINIRKYQRPLNWMLNYSKNKIELSNASKRGWVNFKKDTERYNKWRDGKSKCMKKLSSDEQKRRANIFWNSITDDEYAEWCDKVKKYWTPDKRLEKSNNMKKFYSNPLNREIKSKETKKRWDLMDSESRDEFNEKMSVINKDENKRKLAGIKLKELWKNDDYLNKMKNRKHNPGIKLKIIHPSGDVEIIKNMAEMVRIYNISPYLIRKYRDKNKKIKKSNLNNENIILLNCIIESIEN